MAKGIVGKIYPRILNKVKQAHASTLWTLVIIPLPIGEHMERLLFAVALGMLNMKPVSDFLILSA